METHHIAITKETLRKVKEYYAWRSELAERDCTPGKYVDPDEFAALDNDAAELVDELTADLDISDDEDD